MLKESLLLQNQLTYKLKARDIHAIIEITIKVLSYNMIDRYGGHDRIKNTLYVIIKFLQ